MNDFFTALLAFLAFPAASPVEAVWLESMLPCVADCTRCYA
jgi:hypothetical protein